MLVLMLMRMMLRTLMTFMIIMMILTMMLNGIMYYYPNNFFDQTRAAITTNTSPHSARALAPCFWLNDLSLLRASSRLSYSRMVWMTLPLCMQQTVYFHADGMVQKERVGTTLLPEYLMCCDDA